MTKILGIESSCDDSCIAIVDQNRNIIANLRYSQLAEHQPHGGVVPEIAARTHIKMLPRLMRHLLTEHDLSDIDAIAVTAGPGLIGGVMVGSMFAKGLSLVTGIPILAINHLEGHVLTARLTDPTLDFPFMLLLMSGGHCQIIVASAVSQYQIIGETIDDALGEVFDKIARKLNLGYPGGPAIERLALNGDPLKYSLPHSFTQKNTHCNFSFSGLKTAVLRLIEGIPANSQQEKQNIAASFQYTVLQIICNRLNNAINIYQKINNNESVKVVLAGGVAANQYLRRGIEQHLQHNGGHTAYAPPIELCTDNAAMIAWAGLERMQAGLLADDLDFEPRPSWSLQE